MLKARTPGAMLAAMPLRTRPPARFRRLAAIVLGGRWGVRVLPVLALAALVVLKVPAALAFPYRVDVGATTVYAERPVGAAIVPVLARADRLLAASPIDEPGLRRQIVLTDGGWRWRLLALNLHGAVALRRPFSDVLLFNRSDVARDRVSNGAAISGTRTLSGTIAHETVHLLVARRIGEWRAARLPVWKREGYADAVAGETSIDPADEARIRARDPHAPVLAYYDGRRQVAAALRRNGGSVDALLAD
ncbi:hypothetical protein [Sphingomonas corticis]|jgi:hypothetical protein|uniref:Peptidase MA-like domain-containing protein n=1 Tax=Sphingomonas corticis TaxID=2722791 RepID=A0ABX1CPR0_9SPHN|nr:hypothetical protein [Sphingomonas corticis]NJR79934.1 hypothetical protein [Sphingomonas corticis]